MSNSKKNLIIACGALAREIKSLIKSNNWNMFDITCLPAIWHNSPEQIVPQIRHKIHTAKESGKYNNIIVAYGDCGTGGSLDKLLKIEGVKRIEGSHCYEFYAGVNCFEDLANQEIGTFYLTDYLVKFFDNLILNGLGINSNPELQEIYFKNYNRLVYLAQVKDPNLKIQAKKAAKTLGLSFTYKYTGYGALKPFLRNYST